SEVESRAPAILEAPRRRLQPRPIPPDTAAPPAFAWIHARGLSTADSWLPGGFAGRNADRYPRCRGPGRECATSPEARRGPPSATRRGKPRAHFPERWLRWRDACHHARSPLAATPKNRQVPRNVVLGPA